MHSWLEPSHRLEIHACHRTFKGILITSLLSSYRKLCSSRGSFALSCDCVTVSSLATGPLAGNCSPLKVPLDDFISNTSPQAVPPCPKGLQRQGTGPSARNIGRDNGQRASSGDLGKIL